MRIQREIEVARPIEEVFDYVADPRHEVEWHPRVRSMEKTSDGPIEAGTTFRGDFDLTMRPRGAFRLVLPLLAPAIRRQYAQVMPSLARALAARS